MLAAAAPRLQFLTGKDRLPQGHAANFVETEQVMEFNTSLEGTQLSVAAFVQVPPRSLPSTPPWLLHSVSHSQSSPAPPCPAPNSPAASLFLSPQLRGSVPLLWMQPPNLQLLPRLTLGPPDSGRAALQAHFAELHKTYGQVSSPRPSLPHTGVPCPASFAPATDAALMPRLTACLVGANPQSAVGGAAGGAAADGE